jgi:hypothetical protein
MVKIKIRILLLPIIFIGFGSNASPIIFSGVSTMNTNNRLGFDFFHQVACSTIASYSGCYDNFYIYGGGPLTVLETAGNSGYAAKIGQVNLDSMKTAPADSVFALSPLWIDQIPFDSLPYRVGCSYWIKTSPDNIEGGQILFAKIRILSFPIMDSIKPETEMTFLYAVTPSGGRSCITSGLDTFHLPYYPTGVLPPGASPGRTAPAFSSSGELVFKVAGNKFILPKELEGAGGYLTVFSLTGRRLERVAFDGKTREIRLSGAGRSANGAVVVRVER